MSCIMVLANYMRLYLTTDSVLRYHIAAHSHGGDSSEARERLQAAMTANNVLVG